MSETIIIGGGIAGLTAAYYLQESRIPYTLLEATERVGGRMKTDEVEGYYLDHGFQVFLTQYPEAKKVLDYEALDLHFFRPGAVILKKGGQKSWIGDPFRDFKSLFPTLRSGIGNLSDKFKMLGLRTRLSKSSIEEIFAQEERSTLDHLKKIGFSDAMISQFFAPFYRGIFLEDDLSTSNRMFEFVFKMFSEGFACVPAKGIEAIPNHLMQKISRHDVRCHSKVVKIANNEVVLENGDTLPFKQLILATDEKATHHLLGLEHQSEYRSTLNMYFETESTSLQPQLIHLLPDGVVNNVCDLSSVMDAPNKDGKHLISLSIRSGKEEVASPDLVRKEMMEWFPEAQTWKHIKSYHVHYALPNQSSVAMSKIEKSSEGYILCGDFQMNGSVNAAMKSGRLAAETVIKELAL